MPSLAARRRRLAIILATAPAVAAVPARPQARRQGKSFSVRYFDLATTATGAPPAPRRYPLPPAGAVPVDRSKSDLGSDCR